MSAVHNNSRLTTFAPPTRTHTLATLPPGIVELIWKDPSLGPLEMHHLSQVCRGILATRVEMETKIKVCLRCDMSVFFAWARGNFVSDGRFCELDILFLINSLTLPSKERNLKKIYLAFLDFFLSLSNQDLVKIDGIDYLPLNDLKGEIVSALAVASLTRAALPDAHGIRGIGNVDVMLNFRQLSEILRREIKVFELLILQGRYREAFEFVEELPLSIWAKQELKKEGLSKICTSLIFGVEKNLERAIQILDDIMIHDVHVGNDLNSYSSLSFIDWICYFVSSILDQAEAEDHLDSLLELTKKLRKKGRPDLLAKMAGIFSEMGSFNRAIEILDILGPPRRVDVFQVNQVIVVVNDLCNASRFDEAKMVSRKMFRSKRAGKRFIFAKQHPFLSRICEVFWRGNLGKDLISYRRRWTPVLFSDIITTFL